MFDDIKTWLNNTLHSSSLGRLTASEFKFNRSALGCAVAPLLVSPIPGPHPGNMILPGSKGIHPYQATPPHHIVRGYPTGVLHKVDPPITCILQDGVGTPSRTLLTKIIKPPDVVWSYISGSDLPGDSFFSPHWSWRFDVRAHHDRQRPAHTPRKWKHCFSLHRRGIKQRWHCHALAESCRYCIWNVCEPADARSVPTHTT